MNEHFSQVSAEAVRDRAIRAFTERFGQQPDLLAQAPGRVNLIGEHTDYNDGFVLPMAVDRRTAVAAAANPNGTIRLFASDLVEEMVEIPLNRPLTPGEPRWANYVRGVLAQFVEAGHTLRGFDAAIASTVPMGAGLSSSAALEIATALAAQQLLGLEPDPMRTARWCQRAEHAFAGMPCGIMDQLASVLAEPGCAMQIDCRTLQIRHVPVDAPELAVLVTDSRVRHELAESEYPLRREQCRQAVELFQRHAPNIHALRDVTPRMLDQEAQNMDPTLHRRARHVVTENDRVLRFAEALDRDDWAAAGTLMDESHRSLRDDYEVSCPELDLLVSLAGEVEGVFGSRMTGGGFGGCTVTLARAEAIDTLVAHLERRYAEEVGRPPSCFLVSPAAGASVETL